MSKKKGSRTERELVHMFFENGWVAVRAAGSGSMPLPCPDILAGCSGRILAIECKSAKDDYIYLTKEEVSELNGFSKRIGGEAWIGVRFNNRDWAFLRAGKLKSSGKHFAVNSRLAERKGINFKSLTSLD